MNGVKVKGRQENKYLKNLHKYSNKVFILCYFQPLGNTRLSEGESAAVIRRFLCLLPPEENQDAGRDDTHRHRQTDRAPLKERRFHTTGRK